MLSLDCCGGQKDFPNVTEFISLQSDHTSGSHSLSVQVLPLDCSVSFKNKKMLFYMLLNSCFTVGCEAFHTDSWVEHVLNSQLLPKDFGL